MLRILAIAFFSCISLCSLAQCLTGFQKLASSASPYFSEEYGRSVAIYGDVMAVGANESDSLGYRTGIVYLYRYEGGEWKNFAHLYPSGLEEYAYFGTSLAMGPNYIVVGGLGLGSRLYIFKKPATGWTTMSETAVIYDESAIALANSLTISDDENIIATSESYTGDDKVYLFIKDAASDWSSRSSATQTIESPQGTRSIRFGHGLAIHDNWLAVAQEYNSDGDPIQFIWMYKFQPATLQFTLAATLSSTLPGSSLGNAMVLNDEGLLASQFYDDGSTYGKSILSWFEMPSDGIWKDANQACEIHEIGGEYGRKLHLGIKEMDGDIFVGHTDQTGRNGYVVRLTKGVSGWCDAVQEVIGQNRYNGTNNAYGSNVAAHNGHVAVSYAAIPDNSFYLNGVHALHLDGTTWTSELITNTRTGTTDHWMGEKTFFHQDHLFVSATTDNAIARRAGRVYIYRKSGGTWQHKGDILPVVDSYTDDLFGSAFAAHGDELAVGASGFDPGGAIFIYKNRTDWHQPELVQTITLPDTAEFDLMGYNLVMNERWLISSIQNHSDVTQGPFAGNAVQSSIIIFEKKNGRWEYHGYMDFGNSFVFSKSTLLALDLEGDQLVVGNPYSNATGKVDGVVFLMHYDEDMGEWTVPHFLYSADRENLAAFGTSVELDGDHLFIGAPLKDHDGKRDVGAVYVFRKPAGGWRTSIENSVILPQNKTERQLFGSSLKKLENTLLVGAPGSDLNRDGTPRTVPGEVQVIQSVDYNWTETIPLLILQGDTFTKDYFGFSLDLFGDDMVIGAPVENNALGRPSGVAYVVPAPPLVRLEAPVCTTGGRIQLFGYPFGGSWSGNGITNSATGEFDPAIAGPGSHMLEYVTPNCFYTGKLRIEVVAGPSVTLETEPVSYLCKDNVASTVNLKATFKTGNSYFWYHRASSDVPFSLVNTISSAGITVDRTGQYFVSVTNGICTVSSSVIAVEYEGLSITFPPLPVICDEALHEVQLTATPSGGVWSGPQVNSHTGSVSPALLQNGTHNYQYQYISATGCKFTGTTSLTREVLRAANIEIAGQLCEGRDVLLSVKPEQDASYSWEFSLDQQGVFSTVHQDDSSPALSASQSGYYRLHLSTENCELTTPSVFVNLDKDSLFIPNFISPNGDGKNEDFQIVGTVQVQSIFIYNRFGDRLATLTRDEPWNGDVPSGVYFYIVNYNNCRNERLTKKGTISVRR